MLLLLLLLLLPLMRELSPFISRLSAFSCVFPFSAVGRRNYVV